MNFIKLSQFFLISIFLRTGLSEAQIIDETQEICGSPRPIDKDIHVVAAKTIRPKTDYKVYVKSYHKRDAVYVVAEIITRSPPDYQAKSVVSTSATINPNEQKNLTLRVEDFSHLQDYHLSVTVVNESLKESFDSESSYNDEARLAVIRDYSLVLIQFDKPKYKPGDTVNYHIIVVDENLLPINAPITVGIKNPKGELVYQETQNSTLPNHPGFVKGHFETSRFLSLGQWKLEVKIGKQIETREFEVSEYVLPRFSVTLTAPPYVYAKQRNPFVVTVGSTKPYSNEFYTFHVKSRYSLNVTGPDNIVHNFDKESDGPVNFTISLDEVTKGFCSQAASQKHGSINVSATATEILTGKQQSEWVSLPFYCNQFVLHVKTKSLLFHPEIPFQLDIEIRGHDGKRYPGRFTSANIKATILYSDSIDSSYVDPNPVVDHNEIAPINANNQAKIVLVPKIRTRRIVVVLKLQNVQQNLTFFGYQVSSNQQYMTLEQTTSVLKVGDEAKFKISCTKNCSHIQYIVISRDASVVSGTREFPKTSEHTLSFKIEQGMTPSATLIAYYLTSGCVHELSNQIVSASIKFNVDGFIQNKVNLSITPESGMDYILPGQDPKQKAVLKVSTNPGSLVGTLALDTRLVQLGKANNLTNEGLLREVFNLEKRRSENYTPSNMLSSVSDTFETSGLISFVFTMYGRNHMFPVMANAHNDNVNVKPLKQNAPEWKSSKRTDFRDSFFFNVYTADPFGNVEGSEVVPDSITTWEVSAFSLNSRTGLAFSERPAKLRVFQPVFVEIVKPFNMIRNETVTVDFIITNHLSTKEEMQLHFTIKYADSKLPLIIGRRSFALDPNQSKKEPFNITAPTMGQIVIHAKVFDPSEKKKFSDEISETLDVLSEGIKREETSPKFLVEPNKVLEIPINISQISRRLIDGSQAIRFTLFADDWAPIVATLSSADKSLEGLIKLPRGCGEQNMALFMPNFLIAKYLQTIGKWSENQKRRDQLEKNLAAGYERQFTYRLPDYSFSAFGQPPGSTWLTAYVVRGFSSAKDYIKNPIDDLSNSFDFLERQQTDSGSFIESGSLVDRHHAGHATDGGSAALTAFVVLAFVEGNRTGSVTDKAKRHLLEALPQIRESPYTLAIVTYALAKLKSPEARTAAQRLIKMGIVKEKENFIYWTENPNEVSVSGKTVETTAYAMLALETLGLHNETMPALKWLLSIERNINGGFVSTQDTVVALTALSEVAVRTKDDAVNMLVKMKFQPSNIEKSRSFHEKNILLFHDFDMPSNTTNVVVTATRTGKAQARISYIFNEPPSENALSKFFLDAQVEVDSQQQSKLITLNVKCKYIGSGAGTDGQVLLEVPALTGYEFDESTKDTLMSDPDLDVGNVEMGPKGASLTIYFNKLNRTMKTFELLLSQTVKVHSRKPRTINMYEYFEPKNARSSDYRL